MVRERRDDPRVLESAYQVRSLSVNYDGLHLTPAPSLVALARLFVSRRPSLESLPVKGDLIVNARNRNSAS